METFSASLALCAANSPVTGEFPHKGQRRGALMFSLICAWISGWVNNREAGDLRRHRAQYDVTVMTPAFARHCWHRSACGCALVQTTGLAPDQVSRQSVFFVQYIHMEIIFSCCQWSNGSLPPILFLNRCVHLNICTVYRTISLYMLHSWCRMYCLCSSLSLILTL